MIVFVQSHPEEHLPPETPAPAPVEAVPPPATEEPQPEANHAPEPEGHLADVLSSPMAQEPHPVSLVEKNFYFDGCLINDLINQSLQEEQIC